jgi:hypothetical protein
MKANILILFCVLFFSGCVKSDVQEIVAILSKPIEIKALKTYGFTRAQDCGGGFGCYTKKYKNNIVFVVPDHGEEFTKNFLIQCYPATMEFSQQFKQQLSSFNAIFDRESHEYMISPARNEIAGRFRIDSIYYNYMENPLGDSSTINIWYDFESNGR